MNTQRKISKATLLILLLIHFQLNAQVEELPFQAGEKLYYQVAYNWHFVWVDAGKAEFSVDNSSYGARPAYWFKSSGRTLSAYDWIFKVRDEFESLADAATFQPFWFRRSVQEGSYRLDEKLSFDYQTSQITVQSKAGKKEWTKSEVPYIEGVLDVQTAVYYARSLDFSRMKVGEKIDFKMIIGSQVYDIYGRYHGLEVVENHDGNKYRCHKFSALLVEGTIFSGGEDLFVWVTDDRNKIPILVEAKILVGSVKAYFIKGENLKFPFETLKDTR